VSRTLQVIVTAVLLALVVIAASYTFFRPDGKTMFIEQGCVRCHTFRGVGKGAIDLSHVSEKWSAERIRDQIRNPRVNNPETGMPNFGHLSDRQVDALIEFLRGKGSKA
jgi:mono/diheme cytochrome c family protein